MKKLFTLSLLLPLLFSTNVFGQGVNSDDVFNLEYASDPLISPDGKQEVYSRRSLDSMRRWSTNLPSMDGFGHHYSEQLCAKFAF